MDSDPLYDGSCTLPIQGVAKALLQLHFQTLRWLPAYNRSVFCKFSAYSLGSRVPASTYSFEIVEPEPWKLWSPGATLLQPGCARSRLIHLNTLEHFR